VGDSGWHIATFAWFVRLRLPIYGCAHFPPEDNVHSLAVTGMFRVENVRPILSDIGMANSFLAQLRSDSFFVHTHKDTLFAPSINFVFVNSE
jgi:hypothetical protein